MKRFFSKIGRFFWAWGFLKFVLWTATIIVLFYVEEDWRGARMWAATKAKWEAKGESLDYAKFIPPTVPDDQNLAAIPLFKLEQREYTPGKFTPEASALEKAMRQAASGIEVPLVNGWIRGELPDMVKINKYAAAMYAKAFPGEAAPSDPLAQFDAVFPFVDELRAESSTRPLCQFSGDYSTWPPASRALGPLTRQIMVSKLVGLHALLALDAHKPDVALEDVKVIFKLADGVSHDPTLVASMLANGMIIIIDEGIFTGLSRHEWNDAQLAEIERTQRQLDYLAMFQFSFRCEAAESIANIDYFRHRPVHDIYLLLAGFNDLADDKHSFFLRPEVPWAAGWWDSNKSLMADYLLGMVSLVDPHERRVFPEKSDETSRKLDEAHERWDAHAPWRIWFNSAAGPLGSVAKQFSFVQVRSDEVRIACALERYRLARGSYPKTLDELGPDYIDALPNDVINGEAYRYRLNPDGTYLLYSVGWNGVDDGGENLTFKKAGGVNYDLGDWVWPGNGK